MPMIDLTLPAGALDEGRRAELVDQLSRTVAKWEGVSDYDRAARTVWLFVDERPADAMYVGGRPAGRPRYRLRLTTVEGALDDERKAGLVAEVTQNILDAEGSPNEPANAARVWCHIVELPDGNWGTVGEIWRLSRIAEFAGVELPQETLARSS